MGKQLILAEKPSVAREIARVLGAGQNQNGYIEGPRHVVTWALGHLVTLAEPEAYGSKYSTWTLDSLPILPEKMELVVIGKTAKQFSTVRSLMLRPDVTDLVIATDSGREGELVARWIMEKAGFRKPASRLWISSQTDKAIKDGFAALKPAAHYDSLFKSAVCRAQADWLVGLNVTRALTCKYNAQLSAGRVQTPTLSMIVRREDEIRRFKPQDYYRIVARASTEAASGGSQAFELAWRHGKTAETRIFDKASADALISRLTGKPAKIVSVKTKQKTDPPPQAYDLAELQRDANRRYAYSSKTTLSILQALYETHKLVTYPRTDSRCITEDVAATLRDRLKAVNKGTYAAVAGPLLSGSAFSRGGGANPSGKIRYTSRFVDDAKVTDHHAIIPTEQPMNMSALNNDEKRVYDLIVKRFLAVLSPAGSYEETDVAVDIGGETFAARGRVNGNPGWRSVYAAGVGLAGSADENAAGADEGAEGAGSLYEDAAAGEGAAAGEDAVSDEDVGDIGGYTGRDMPLPPLKAGGTLRVHSINPAAGKTRPPARYTEATLLTAMEHPGKDIGDRELRDALENASGIGTPATRADIIERLFSAFYVERGGKSGRELIPTSKGRQLVGLVPEDLQSAELTARWEYELERMANKKHIFATAAGKRAAPGAGPAAGDALFIKEIRDYTAKLVSAVAASSASYNHDNMTRDHCPECGKYLLSVNGKKGEMLVCQDRECGYRVTVSVVSNARCPNCHKKLTLRGSGESRYFHCICGHRERLADFEARRESSVGRREVDRFLAGQAQSEQSSGAINSALSDQLKEFLPREPSN